MFCLLLLMKKRSASKWVLDFECTYHVHPHKDLFSTYDHVDFGVVNMDNDAECKVAGIGTVHTKTHDGVVRTLTKVWHVPDLNQNLISLGVLEAKGFGYLVEGGVLKVSKGARVLLKGLRHEGLYVL